MVEARQLYSYMWSWRVGQAGSRVGPECGMTQQWATGIILKGMRDRHPSL